MVCDGYDNKLCLALRRVDLGVISPPLCRDFAEMSSPLHRDFFVETGGGDGHREGERERGREFST